VPTHRLASKALPKGDAKAGPPRQTRRGLACKGNVSGSRRGKARRSSARAAKSRATGDLHRIGFPGWWSVPMVRKGWPARAATPTFEGVGQQPGTSRPMVLQAFVRMSEALAARRLLAGQRVTDGNRVMSPTDHLSPEARILPPGRVQQRQGARDCCGNTTVLSSSGVLVGGSNSQGALYASECP